MEIWNKIKQIVDKINTNPKTGSTFLGCVLLLGAFGIGCCLAWFILMILAGMVPLWALIFDGAIIAFCCWAIVYAVIPWSKKAFKMMNDKERNQ
jgi:hypothetical protein